MRRRMTSMTVVLFLFGFAPSWNSSVLADVGVGDVIDRTNWQRIEGLVPEPLLNWMKLGDSIKIGEISYDPGTFLPPACLESLKTNVDR